jgi:hypothetical protein
MILHARGRIGVHREPSEWFKDQAVSGYKANSMVPSVLGRSFARIPQRGSSWDAFAPCWCSPISKIYQINKRHRDLPASRCCLILALVFHRSLQTGTFTSHKAYSFNPRICPHQESLSPFQTWGQLGGLAGQASAATRL